MKDRIRKKRWICILLALLLAGITTGILSEAKEGEIQKKIAGEVFRFHVIANSDSDEDQALKMLVKENVIAYMKQELPESDSASMTKSWVQTHLSEIEEVAVQTLRKEGCSDRVSAQVMECYFPDKSYGDLTFPKGMYEALRIEIGEAKGHNWWCVLYPNLCFIDAVHAIVPEEGKAELKEVLDTEEYEMVTATSKFKIKWFFLDLLGDKN